MDPRIQRALHEHIVIQEDNLLTIGDRCHTITEWMHVAHLSQTKSLMDALKIINSINFIRHEKEKAEANKIAEESPKETC